MLELKGRRYHQVQSLRDLTRSNFPNGQIRFNWSVPAGESWNPYLSFFTIRHEIASYTRANVNQAGPLSTIIQGNQIGCADAIAPSMFLNDSLWQQIEFKINGITINKQDNYVHQIASLKHRMSPEDKQKTWNRLNFSQIDFRDRNAQISQDGYYDKNSQQGFQDLSDYVNPNRETGVPVTVAIAAQADPALVATITLTGINIFELGIVEGDVFAVNIPGATVARGLITDADSADTGFQFEVAFGQSIAQVAARTPLKGEFYISSGPSKIQRIDNINLNAFETIWKPKLGIFDCDLWLPGGEYEIILTPFPTNQYRRSAIEILSNTVSNIEYNVLNMEFNLCSCAHPSKNNEVEFLESRCQAKTINTSSLSQKQFNVNPNTMALTVAYQDNRVQSRFDITGAKFKIASAVGDIIAPYEDYELTLQRFYVQYDGEVLPNPIPDIRIRRNDQSAVAANRDIQNEDFISQRFWETQLYKMLIYENIETLNEWKERGPYYHFQWPRQNKDAIEVQVSQEFRDALPNGVNPQLLLFEHYPCRYKFDMHMGYITGVKKLK